ncbi:MAG: tRNA pseudouridine(38-40) synthase TruA [Planctomycetota bacterium]|nr:MAG: tRNA pseudouridine(38-40) synthase TruA [Planctomycetota bacterium]
MKYFLQIAYDGTAYRGWQRQEGVLGIQETLEETLSQVLGETISVFGCGRTDAKVHATQYFVHMEVNAKWDYDLVYRLNQNLPNDIAVFEVFSVADDAHARYDVSERTYEYYIHTNKNPFFDDRSFLYQHKKLDCERMKTAVNLLLNYTDYLSFCKTPDHNNTTICTVTGVSFIWTKSKDQMKFTITANRFLRGMVRVIVQRLVDIGRGDLSLEEFEEMLLKPKSPEIKSMVSPSGLYLTKVCYSYHDSPFFTKPPPYFN